MLVTLNYHIWIKKVKQIILLVKIQKPLIIVLKVKNLLNIQKYHLMVFIT